MATIDATASLLVERYGVAPGDRVAIGMRNYPEWVTTFAAVTSIGAVAVALNAWWTADELAYGLRDSGATVLVADQERAERIAPMLADMAGLRVVSVRHKGDVPAGVDRFEDVVEVGAPMPVVEIDPDDDATILYTSGTTGEPKGRGLDAPRRDERAHGLRLPIDRQRRDEERSGEDAQPVSHLVHPDRSALPRHRSRTGDAGLDPRRATSWSSCTSGTPSAPSS